MAARKSTIGPVESGDKRTQEIRTTDSVECHTWEIEVRQFIHDLPPSLT